MVAKREANPILYVFSTDMGVIDSPCVIGAETTVAGFTKQGPWSFSHSNMDLQFCGRQCTFC